MAGTARSISAIGPSTRLPYAASHCSRLKLSGSPAGGPPVLTTRISIAPSSSSTVPIRRSASSRSALSCTNARAPETSTAAASMRSCEREDIATRAPSPASALAMPRPRPFEAPVTSATLPSMPRSIAAKSISKRDSHNCNVNAPPFGTLAAPPWDGPRCDRHSRPPCGGAARVCASGRLPAPTRVPGARGDDRRPRRRPVDGARSRHDRGRGRPSPEARVPALAAQPADRHVRRVDDGEPVLRPLPRVVAERRRPPDGPELRRQAGPVPQYACAGNRLPGLRSPGPRPRLGRRAHPGCGREDGRLPPLLHQRRVRARLLQPGRPRLPPQRGEDVHDVRPHVLLAAGLDVPEPGVHARGRVLWDEGQQH